MDWCGLKGTILFLTVIVAVMYGFLFPQLIEEFGSVNFPWLVAPVIVAVSFSSVPIVIALVLFWQICTEIGRDNSFCHKNAGRLSGIGFCALIDTAYCVLGTATIFVVTGGHPGVFLLSTAAVVCGLAIALASFLLSHLVVKAADMKEEQELTI